MTLSAAELADALEPECPNCGMTDLLPWPDPDNPSAIQAVCQGCGMRGPFSDTADNAVLCLDAMNRRAQPVSHSPLASEFDALAEKATQGEMVADQDMPYAHRPSVWSDARNIGQRGWVGRLIAHVGNMEDPREAQNEWEANAAFIAWCFNHRTEISAALRSHSTPAQGEDWRPIETAPKDGTDVLVCVTYSLGRDEWHTDMWIDWRHKDKDQADWQVWPKRVDLPCGPTHWHPLPQPPRDMKGETE